MKYVIDAHLPIRLSSLLASKGFDSVHTLDLADKNRTRDCDINTLSIKEERVVVTKDADFIESLVISNKPFKLLHVATGNISNKGLIELFAENIQHIDALFASSRYIEINSEFIVVHR